MPWEDPAFYADTPNTKESCSGPISDSPAGKYLWCKKMTLVLKQVRQNYVGVVEPQYKQSNIINSGSRVLPEIIVVWIYDTFDDDFEIQNDFTNYLKESCCTDTSCYNDRVKGYHIKSGSSFMLKSSSRNCRLDL